MQLRRVLLAGGLGFFMASAMFTGSGAAQPTTPPLDGEYGVGVVETDWKHDFPDAAARLKVKVWYPADPGVSGPTARYFSDREASMTVSAIETTLGFETGSMAVLAEATTRSVEGAPIADHASFPLIMFGHGFWFYVSQNTALMEKLASHGYVVVSVAHPKDSMPVIYSDGFIQGTVPHDGESGPAEKAYFSAGSHGERISLFSAFQAEIADKRVTKSHHTWVRDVLAVIDDMECGTASKDLASIVPSIDFDTVAFGGMSFGGATAVSACALHSACKAAFNLDGLQFNAIFFNQDVSRALLMINADVTVPLQDNDPNCKHQSGASLHDYYYESHETAGLNSNIVRIRVRDVLHMGFTDLPWFSTTPAHSKVLGSATPELSVEAVNATIRQFLDVHLKGAQNLKLGDPEIEGLEFRSATSIREWTSDCR